MKPASLHRFAPSSTPLRFLKPPFDVQGFSSTRACTRPREAPRGSVNCGTGGAAALQAKWKGFPARSSVGRHSSEGASFTRKPMTLRSASLSSPGGSLQFMRQFASTPRRELLNFLRTKVWDKQECGPYSRRQPLPTFLDENEVLRRRLRATNEMRLRCTEFDENGNVTIVNGEFKKTELIQKYGLLPRDLRKIDSSILPHVLVRPSAILLNLLHLRVLIKHDRVLVFDAYGTTDSYNQSSFMYDIDQKLRQRESAQTGILAYEFRALEAVLLSVTNSLESEFEGLSEPVVSVLRELEEDIDRDKLRYLLIYSKKLGTFEQKARLVRDALSELLETDEDLSAMYLTEKAAGKTRRQQEHTEVEMLLESYHKIADEIVQAAENLVSNIRNTEEIVKAILDANRNSLMLLDLKFSIFTLGIGAGTFVAALYGMNLKNFIEETDLGFGAISAWCTVFGIVVCIYGLQKLRSVQRVSMWGEHGRRMAWSGPDTLMRRDAERRALQAPRKTLRFWERERRRALPRANMQGKAQEKTEERTQEMGKKPNVEKDSGEGEQSGTSGVPLTSP